MDRELNFIESDVHEIEKELINKYQEIADRTLSPADPITGIFKTFAAVLSQTEEKINDTAKQNLLRYARDERLDFKGELFSTDRLGEEKAKTTLKFTISAPQIKPVVIPIGTRVTPGNNIYFSTISECVIQPNEIEGIVEAECTEAGTEGNGYVDGTINKIVDTFKYQEKVENITLSNGGSGIEDDEHYRERIHGSPEKFTTAGPKLSYEYWAKTASPTISDVKVISTNPGIVDIYVLENNGDIPNTNTLSEVKKTCNDESVRPLTDKVEVHAPKKVLYDIDFDYYITKANETRANEIKTAVSNVVNEYILWQKNKIGRDIVPDELIARLKEVGVKRAVITSPVYKRVDIDSVAIVSDNKNYIFKGAEDE